MSVINSPSSFVIPSAITVPLYSISIVSFAIGLPVSSSVKVTLMEVSLITCPICSDSSCESLGTISTSFNNFSLSV